MSGISGRMAISTRQSAVSRAIVAQSQGARSRTAPMTDRFFLAAARRLAS